MAKPKANQDCDKCGGKGYVWVPVGSTPEDMDADTDVCECANLDELPVVEIKDPVDEFQDMLRGMNKKAGDEAE